MKENLTELVFILDKSGSMCGLEKDTIGGFNSLLSKQKKEDGEALVTTVLFSDNAKIIHDRLPINEVPELTDKQYYVSGCTALLDTVGNTINHITAIHNKLDSSLVPEKTMIIITTDGYENASREYSYGKIKTLIEQRKELGWEFIFLGANIDASLEAKKFGIDEDNAVDFNCDGSGIELNYSSLDEAITEVRKEKRLSQRWRRDIDHDYKSRKSKF